MNILKEARRGKYTQKQVAERLGVTRQTYAKWERGEVDDIRLSTLDELSKLLRLSPLDIIQMKELKHG